LIADRFPSILSVNYHSSINKNRFGSKHLFLGELRKLQEIMRRLKYILCACAVVLIVDSGTLKGQTRHSRINSNSLSTTIGAPTANPQEALQSSKSGKLTVGGLHAGLQGILHIQTDISLKGPLGISVVNQQRIVKQSGSDALIISLSRDTSYQKPVALAPGLNIIKVMDMSDPQENVMLSWNAVEAGAEGIQPIVAPPVTLPDGAIRTPSGKVIVTSISTDDEIFIKVTVDSSIRGPFKVTLVDEAGKTIQNKTVKLERAENNFTLSLPLAKGKNEINVSSTDTDENAETVKLSVNAKGPKTPTESKPTFYEPNLVKESESKKVSVAATRINGNIDLKVHLLENVSGFKVVAKDKDNNEIFNKDYTNLPRGVNDWDVLINGREGSAAVTVTALTADGKVSTDAKDEVALTVPAEARLRPADGASGGSTNDFYEPNIVKPSNSNKVSAAATRINGNIDLKVHLSNDVSGFRVIAKDKSNNEIFNRSYRELRRGVNDWSVLIIGGEGENTVTVTAINLDGEVSADVKDEVELKVPEEAKLLPAESISATINPNSINTRAIVGFEQVGGSSSESQTQPFVDLFFSAPLTRRLSGWGNIRLSAVPEQIATLGTLPSNFINPLAEGRFTNSLVQSFDFMAGLDYLIYPSRISTIGLIPGIKQKTGVYIVAGGGAISPLSTSRNLNAQIFAVPAATSPQRDLFISRYGAVAANKQYIALVFPQRDRFLRQFYGGFRFKTYYYDKNARDEDDPINRFPALLDVMFGQSEAVTGGSLKTDVTDSFGKIIGRKRIYVLRLEAFYPMPIREANFIYLFGTAILKVGAGGPRIDTPLILDTAPSNVLVTSDSVFIAPALQANRDYYRIGVGVNLIELFNRQRRNQ
jgi:hypothetical protein